MKSIGFEDVKARNPTLIAVVVAAAVWLFVSCSFVHSAAACAQDCEDLLIWMLFCNYTSRDRHSSVLFYLLENNCSLVFYSFVVSP